MYLLLLTFSSQVSGDPGPRGGGEDPALHGLGQKTGELLPRAPGPAAHSQAGLHPQGRHHGAEEGASGQGRAPQEAL